MKKSNRLYIYIIGWKTHRWKCCLITTKTLQVSLQTDFTQKSECVLATISMDLFALGGGPLEK